MNIYFSLSTVEDIENIKEYYLEQGVSQIGQKFVTEIIEHTETLSSHSGIGTRRI